MTVLGIPYRRLRAGLLVLLVLDVLVLAAFSVRLGERTQVTSYPAGTPGGQVQAAPPGATPSAAPAPAPAGVPLAGAPVVPVAADVPVDVPSTAAPAAPAAPAPRPTPTPTPSAPGGPDESSTDIAPCPIDVVEGGPEKNAGGLQSLIPFAPAFGPFSAEAFAAAAVYQPALQLIGPLLSQYPKLAPVLEPALTPLLDAFGSGATSLFDLISPLYAPYRTQVLEAEGKLAAALAPFSRQLAGSALGGCVIELQNALLEHADALG